jgi:hypothetical protein
MATDVIFSPRGKRVLTCDNVGGLAMWDTRTPRERAAPTFADQ